MKCYVIGSLRNPAVPELGNELRAMGFDAFDDWYGAGETADDSWQAYEEYRGRTYDVALYGAAATNIYEFDRRHLDSSEFCVMLLPAGKSGHIEFGYIVGQGKPGYILMDGLPARWDVMYRFADGVFFDKASLFEALAKLKEERDGKVG